MIEFEDGSTIEAQDWKRILMLVQQQVKEKKPAPVSIEQGGVTIKLNGLKVNTDAKIDGPDYSKYIESKYKGYKIRVWQIPKDKIYGVNYFMDPNTNEKVHYAEVPYTNVKDENGVFKYIQGIIDEM